MTSTRSLFLSLTASLALVAEPALAQDDINIFGVSVPPNVLVLMDNSGSMAHLLWKTGFNQNQFQDFGGDANGDGVTGDPWISTAYTSCNTGTFNLGAVPVIASSTGFCPGSREAGSICPDSSGGFLQAGDKFRC